MLGINSLGKCVVQLHKLQSCRGSITSIATVPLYAKRVLQREPLEWQTQGLKPGNKAPTEVLFIRRLKEAFPNEEIYFKVRKTVNIKHPDTGLFLEIDASIPRLKFHVEYQDPYHYTSAIHYVNRPVSEIQMLDAYKKKVLTERGESLLQLPCWWQGDLDSMIATIKAIRPDICQKFSPSSPPVPETPPEGFFEYNELPDVGVLMKPVFFTQRYFESSSEWVAGEKYDGVRFLWNPKSQQLYSKQGNELRFLEKFKQLMPGEFLDGEIWFGQTTFQDAAKLKSGLKADVKWDSLRLVAFDIPSELGVVHKEGYKERYARLHEFIPRNHPFLEIPPRIQIDNESSVKDLQELVRSQGGEGLVLMKLNTPYEHGYSSAVMKIKPHRDTEALVVSRNGNFVVLQLPNATTFRSLVPSHVQPAPEEGDVVTISFKRHVQGSPLPENPKILRVRSDVNWDEILSSTATDPLSNQARDYTARWDPRIDTIREQFIQFAKDHDFDPFIPDNWYKIQRSDILAIKGASNMLRGFNKSVSNALVAAFPDIGLDKSKFFIAPKHHWTEINNIRKWFDAFAKEKGFNPLVAINWYNTPRFEIVSKKGARSILNQFKGSHINALIAAYHDIVFDASQFRDTPKHHWNEVQNIRKMFDRFAKANGFDPLVSTNWYTVQRSEIMQYMKGALNRFKKSHINALVTVYPDIGLEKAKFSNIPRHYWGDLRNVRKWFEEFASIKGFDPHIAKNWYNVTQEDIIAVKGGSSILHNFRNLQTALLQVFPTIGLLNSSFHRTRSRD